MKPKIKRAVLAVLIFLMMTGIAAGDAWAGAQVYLTVSVGGGLVIGVVGVFIHVVFVQRIAEQQKQEEQRMAAMDPLRLNTIVGPYGRTPLPIETDQSRPQSLDRNLYLERFNPISENRRQVHPDLEVRFFTFQW